MSTAYSAHTCNCSALSLQLYFQLLSSLNWLFNHIHRFLFNCLHCFQCLHFDTSNLFRSQVNNNKSNLFSSSNTHNFHCSVPPLQLLLALRAYVNCYFNYFQYLYSDCLFNYVCRGNISAASTCKSCLF